VYFGYKMVGLLENLLQDELVWCNGFLPAKSQQSSAKGTSSNLGLNKGGLR